MHDPEILIVEDDPATLDLLVAHMKGLGRLRVATRPDRALQLAVELPPDLILLDAELPGMSGFEVCEALKAEPGLAEVPVIFVTGHIGLEFELAGLRLGAADFIRKPVHKELLRARAEAQLRIKRMADQLRALARVDAATGCANAAAVAEALPREWRRALRERSPLALLAAELDAWPAFVERYGERSAQAALRRVAQALAACAQRPADQLASIGTGPGRFLLLLPATPRRGAAVQAQRLLAAVEALDIAHADAPLARHLTLSLGLAVFDAASPGWPRDPHAFVPWQPAQLQAAADAALQAAQAAGGAQACWLDVADAGDVGRAQALERALVQAP
jgi:diguanylate cyclase (GGDEF)-like protein